MNAALGPTERVLLVGDGDFSFSLSLTKYLPPSCIVSTNLETEETIRKHKNVQENIKELLEKGAHLILGVDARHLHTHPQVGELCFQRIIFNFPHIGGKSNNKKNRALLNDFFESAAGVLVPEGEVMVTLCQGQGGTPADKMQRLWADTWQIVSMAANSGFILTEVVPFESETYPIYSCTGFRSQDKGFHIEGSLTHSFQIRDTIPVPKDDKPLPVFLDKKEFLCPTYLHSKISSYRKILQNPLHPFTQTQVDLFSEIKNVKIIHEDQLPCIMQRSDLSVSGSELNACLLRLCKSLAEEEEKETVSISNQQESPTLSSNGPSPSNILQLPHNQQFLKDAEEFYFRTSLIENIPFLLKSEDFNKHQWVMANGLTYRKRPISPGFLPVSIEILGLTKSKTEDIKQTLETVLSDSFKTFSSISTDFVPSTENHSPIQVKDLSIKFLKKIICNNTPEGTCIGHILTVSNQDDEETHLGGFLLSIDDLAQIRFQVDHKSILWQEDIGKFLKPHPEPTSASIPKYEPVSTFPLQFVHDMSLWENPALAFDESQLSCIVQDVAGDYVSSVILIDTYHEPETKRTGRCYRLTFQSWDLCLSYETSWKMQSLIRLVTAEKMGITLR